MLYSLASTRFRRPAVELPSESESDDHATQPGSKIAPKSQPLRGLNVLLLWLPAACDLIGTTVRRISSLPLSISVNSFAFFSYFRHTVDECRPSLLARLHLSNDARRRCSLRWRAQRALPSTPSMVLPVCFRASFQIHA